MSRRSYERICKSGLFKKNCDIVTRYLMFSYPSMLSFSFISYQVRLNSGYSSSEPPNDDSKKDENKSNEKDGNSNETIPAKRSEKSTHSSLQDYESRSVEEKNAILKEILRDNKGMTKEVRSSKPVSEGHYGIYDNAITGYVNSNIYTMTEYLQREDEEFRGGKKLIQKIDEYTDNPYWLLWGMGFIGIAVFCALVGARLRRERLRFDPRLRTVKIIEEVDDVKIGGPWEMLNCKTGKVITDKDLHGKWLYMYFGFINCPDVCPEEMRKMARVTRALDKRVGKNYWQPVFVTLDPKRDKPEKINEYLRDFGGSRILGLTGTSKQCDDMARTFRVYYAIPDSEYFGGEASGDVAANPSNTEEEDYLIDHSIIMYLIDPEGKFVDYTTKEFTWNESYTKLLRRMIDYERERKMKGDYINEESKLVAQVDEQDTLALEDKEIEKHGGATQ